MNNIIKIEYFIHQFYLQNIVLSFIKIKFKKYSLT